MGLAYVVVQELELRGQLTENQASKMIDIQVTTTMHSANPFPGNCTTSLGIISGQYKRRCSLRLFSFVISSGSGSFEPMETDSVVLTNTCNQKGYDAHYEVYFR